MQVDRHAAAVINDTQATIGVEGNVNLTTVAGERFIDRIVDDFLGEMVWPGGVGVHTRPLSDRFQPSEHLNGIGVIFGHALA